MGLEKILQQENIIDENTIQDSCCPTHCSQLWMSMKLVEILKIEKVQRDFMNRIPALRGNNYWAKLKILKMISLQRRQERMIYIWKILEGIAPNCGIVSTRLEDGRQGQKVF